MSDGIQGTEPSLATGNHDRLRKLAAERSVILKRVMRLAVQEMRCTLAVPDEVGQSVGAQFIRGSASGFGDAQFHVLDALVTAGGSLPVGDIADRCHVAVPTVSKMLNHLEETGLIERQVNRSNRRVVHVVLTDAGRATKAEVEHMMRSAVERVFDPLTEAELEDLIAAFGHLSRLVDDEALTTQRRPLRTSGPAIAAHTRPVD